MVFFFIVLVLLLLFLSFDTNQNELKKYLNYQAVSFKLMMHIPNKKQPEMKMKKDLYLEFFFSLYLLRIIVWMGNRPQCIYALLNILKI